MDLIDGAVYVFRGERFEFCRNNGGYLNDHFVRCFEGTLYSLDNPDPDHIPIYTVQHSGNLSRTDDVYDTPIGTADELVLEDDA